jgi:multidrug efflux pump subunit AcrB
VAILGVIALAGIIMRNSVILVDQIKQDIEADIDPREAIIGSAVRRFRPIVLTASAAVLALIPLAGSPFWGPMALAIMGGLITATILTMTFLPALYALAFGLPAGSQLRLESFTAPPGSTVVPSRPAPLHSGLSSADQHRKRVC